MTNNGSLSCCVRLRAWFLLFRPWSYTATLVPFLVGVALASGHVVPGGVVNGMLGLAAGFFFQATVNLLNTWGDERSGVDAVPGAIRTTPQVAEGIVSLGAVGIAGLLCAAAAGVLGLASCFYRVSGLWHFNTPLFAAGLFGLAGATNYSTGIAFKYRGLGVPFVAVLMGPIEIFAACALLAPDAVRAAVCDVPAHLGAWGLAALVALPIAVLVGIILHGNDMRDIPSDRAAGIVTLASHLGPRGALAVYRFGHLLPYAVLVTLAHLGAGRLWLALPLVAAPLTWRTLRAATLTYRASPANPPWRGLERASGAIHFVWGALYALALALGTV